MVIIFKVRHSSSNDDGDDETTTLDVQKNALRLLEWR